MEITWTFLIVCAALGIGFILGVLTVCLLITAKHGER